MVALATEAAVTEARRRGWIAPGEELPAGDDPPTAASLLVAMIGRPYLAHLRGEPGRPILGWRESAAEEERGRRDAEARKKAARYARGDRVMAMAMAGRG